MESTKSSFPDICQEQAKAMVKSMHKKVKENPEIDALIPNHKYKQSLFITQKALIFILAMECKYILLVSFYWKTQNF